MLKKSLTTLALTTAFSLPTLAWADNYKIDIEGAHASVNFRVQHLGYSWVTGRFDKFDGGFEFDAADPAAGSLNVSIDTTSLNTNHAARDKHLRGPEFLNAGDFPEAKFESTEIVPTSDNTAIIKGSLTLMGTTKEVDIEATYVGGGDDPWGGFRQGFEGTTSFTMEDFGIKNILGPASAVVYLDLHVEGVKQ